MNLDEIIQIVQTTPNDAELGGKVRELYNQYRLDSLKKDMFKTSSNGVSTSLKK